MNTIRLPQFIIRKYGLLVMAVIFLWQGYGAIRPKPTTLDPMRAEAAERLAERAAGAISGYAGSDWSDRYIKVARLQGDHGDHIRAMLESALPGRTNCRIASDSLLNGLRDGISDSVARLGVATQPWSDNWKRKPVTTLSSALRLGKSTNVDFVVYGVVSDFRIVDERARAVLEVHVASPTLGTDVFVEQVSEGEKEIHFAVSNSADAPPMHFAIWRIAGWIAFVLFFPVVTASFWIGVLDDESNISTLVAMFFLSGFETLIVWALMDFALTTSWMVLLLGFAAAAAFVWNFFILGLLEQARMAQVGAARRELA